MTVLYQCLDIISTIIELLLYYVIADRFHLTPESKIRKYLLLAMQFVTVYALTWFTELGEFKPAVITCLLTILLCIIYRVSFYKSAIWAMLGMVNIKLQESLAMILASIFQVPLSDMVGDELLLSWQIYVIVIFCRLGGIAAMYILFKNYHYQFTWRDFLIVLFNYVIVEILWAFYNIRFYSGNSDYFSIVMEFLCFLLSVSVLIPFFYMKNYYFLRERAKQSEQMAEQMQARYQYYREKQQEEERVRGVYHDLKNHLLILQTQIENREEVQESLRTLQEQLVEYENYQNTGNDFLNIIIRDKSKTAREKQIDFSSAIQFEDGGFMESLDISTIFGNALDNAIEASEKLPKDQRMITVKASRIRDMLVAIVENTTLWHQEAAGKTTKKDQFLHGFGLANIRRAVEKYGGQCISKESDGLFILKIVIPIPEP